MRLIDADALLAEYDRMHEGEPGKARKLIEDAPTIEERTEKHSYDLISRRSTIDALRAMQTYKMFPGADLVLIDKAGAMTEIMMMPPAQPEQSSEIQDILDYLDTVLHPIVSPEHWTVYSELHDMISALPSVQTDIVQCKNCKHWLDIDDGRQKHRMCADIYGDWFCGDAERRQDG